MWLTDQIHHGLNQRVPATPAFRKRINLFYFRRALQFSSLGGLINLAPVQLAAFGFDVDIFEGERLFTEYGCLFKQLALVLSVRSQCFVSLPLFDAEAELLREGRKLFLRVVLREQCL